jgi:hypothetical protein
MRDLWLPCVKLTRRIFPGQPHGASSITAIHGNLLMLPRATKKMSSVNWSVDAARCPHGYIAMQPIGA